MTADARNNGHYASSALMHKFNKTEGAILPTQAMHPEVFPYSQINHLLHNQRVKTT